MINELYLIIGILVVAFTAADFFYTTVSFNGAGIMARGVSSTMASLFLGMNKKTGSRFLFKFSGMTHILFLVFLWIGLLWVGLFLMLMGDPMSVLHAPSGTPAGIINKFYFSGYVLSTLGNGQYIPNGGGWQVTVAAFSFAGFIFITTAMTYLMNLTTAVIHKRNLSLFISNLGKTPEEIVANSYTGNGFERLTNVIPTLQQMINKHSQNHYAHPGVHYFYSIPRQESLSINLTNLDEALTIMLTRVDADKRLAEDLHPLRDAIDEFLDTIEHHFIRGFEIDWDNTPDISYLQERGISLKDDKMDDSKLQERRALLAGLLQSTGWGWNDIYPQDSNT